MQIGASSLGSLPRISWLKPYCNFDTQDIEQLKGTKFGVPLKDSSTYISIFSLHKVTPFTLAQTRDRSAFTGEPEGGRHSDLPPSLTSTPPWKVPPPELLDSVRLWPYSPYYTLSADGWGLFFPQYLPYSQAVPFIHVLDRRLTSLACTSHDQPSISPPTLHKNVNTAENSPVFASELEQAALQCLWQAFLAFIAQFNFKQANTKRATKAHAVTKGKIINHISLASSLLVLLICIVVSKRSVDRWWKTLSL